MITIWESNDLLSKPTAKVNKPQAIQKTFSIRKRRKVKQIGQKIIAIFRVEIAVF